MKFTSDRSTVPGLSGARVDVAGPVQAAQSTDHRSFEPHLEPHLAAWRHLALQLHHPVLVTRELERSLDADDRRRCGLLMLVVVAAAETDGGSVDREASGVDE